VKKLKDFIKFLFEAPMTPKEIDNIIRKAVSDVWQKEFMNIGGYREITENKLLR